MIKQLNSIQMAKLILLLFLLFSISAGQLSGGRYLIITHDDYYNALKPLVEWKARKGLKPRIVKLSEIGSDSTQIRSFIVNAYNNWQIKPEYLLLVGCKEQLPFPRMRQHFEVCHSDNYYTNITGDFHNEIIPGRFWVHDTLEAKTVITKVLCYEKKHDLYNSEWLRKGTTIVNEDPFPPYSDSVYWADARYAHSLMTNAGFTHIDSIAESFEHYERHVIDAINEGRSYILYRGLGGGVWDRPFSNIYPDDMHNGEKLPIVISATCYTIEGIGKWWLNAGVPNELRGTVGFLGTTTGLMEAAELRSALARGTLESIFCDSLSTLGKAAEAGRQRYYALFGDSLEYDSWNCLGDPEMNLLTTIPRFLEVVHDSELWVLSTSGTIQVNVQHNSAPVESAFVCIMSKKDSTIYQYGRTNNLGDITFIDTFQIAGDTVLVTVTGRNLEPYCGRIWVRFGGGAFVVLNSFKTLDNIGGNGDFIANPGETIEIAVCLKNWGDSTARNVSATIHKVTPDSSFSLDDTIKFYGDIAPFDSAFTYDDGYNVIIAPNCPDSHSIKLQLCVTDSTNSTWVSNFEFTIHAPILFFNDYTFPESLKYTPIGETNQLILQLTNKGSYKAQYTTGKIFSEDSFLIIIDSTSFFGTINPNNIGSNQLNPFIITTSPQTPPCYPLDIKLVIVAGVYTDTFDFTIYVGQKDYFIWDKDLNHSSGPIIKECLDSLNFYGDYSTADLPYGYLSLYKSLFICCGIYPSNYVILDTSPVGDEIEQYLESLCGKVYLEGGDVWYGDPHNYHGYFFHPLFRITPVTNSVGPLPSISGETGTFTESMIFNYTGESNSIDRIVPDTGGVLIFKKSLNYFNCGVASHHRTVGISFEFGGLVDSITPSTKLTLIDSIMQYFGVAPTGIRERKILSGLDYPFLIVQPNPFRNRINIKYSPGQSIEKTVLKIYDVTGRIVKDFSHLTPDTGRPAVLSWNGTDASGRKVAEGVYFVCLQSETYNKTEKVIFLK